MNSSYPENLLFGFKKRINDEVEMNKLKITNKKLIKEVTRHKLIEEESKLKIKRRKVIS